MPESIDQGAAAAVAALQAMVRSVVREEIQLALRNLRPGGLVPYSVTCGDPSTTIAQAILAVPFPAAVAWAEIHADILGGATMDVKYMLPGEIGSVRGGEPSLFGGDFPVLVIGTDVTQLPTSNWVRTVPAGTTLLFYLRAAASTGVTITVVFRALAS